MLNVNLTIDDDGHIVVELEEWGRPYVSRVPAGMTVDDTARVLLMDWGCDGATAAAMRLNVRWRQTIDALEAPNPQPGGGRE